jgi:hypothetical protein
VLWCNWKHVWLIIRSSRSNRGAQQQQIKMKQQIINNAERNELTEMIFETIQLLKCVKKEHRSQKKK